MVVSEGLLYAVISAWGYFYEHRPPPDRERRWKRLERLGYFLCSTVAALPRVRDPCAALDLLRRMVHAAGECERLLEGLDVPEKVRRHLRVVRREAEQVIRGHDLSSVLAWSGPRSS